MKSKIIGLVVVLGFLVGCSSQQETAEEKHTRGIIETAFHEMNRKDQSYLCLDAVAMTEAEFKAAWNAGSPMEGIDALFVRDVLLEVCGQ